MTVWRGYFPSLPANYSDLIESEFLDMLSSYKLGDWEKVGLKAGKLCELLHPTLDGLLSGNFQSAPTKPRNYLRACTQLENLYPVGERSLRIQMPRILIGVYELRNNRSIGHIGGPVAPNYLDAEYFLRSIKWCLAELARIEAEKKQISGSEGFIRSIHQKEFPAIWSDGDVTRVAITGLSAKEKIILVASQKDEWVDVKWVRDVIQYSNLSALRKTLLSKMDKQKLIALDAKADRIRIMPVGKQLALEIGAKFQS